MMSVQGNTEAAFAVKGDAMDASPGFSMGISPSTPPAMAEFSMLSSIRAVASILGVIGWLAARARASSSWPAVRLENTRSSSHGSSPGAAGVRHRCHKQQYQQGSGISALGAGHRQLHSNSRSHGSSRTGTTVGRRRGAN